MTVCAVAVGTNVNMNEIQSIGSNDCTYNPGSFSNLSKAISYGISSRVHLMSIPTLPPNFFSKIDFSKIDFGKRFIQLLKKKVDNFKDSGNFA